MAFGRLARRRVCDAPERENPQHVPQQNLAVFSVAAVEHPLDIAIRDPLCRDPAGLKNCPVLLRSFDQLLSVHAAQCRSHQIPSAEML
jgi:hypothetical protein